MKIIKYLSIISILVFWTFLVVFIYNYNEYEVTYLLKMVIINLLGISSSLYLYRYSITKPINSNEYVKNLKKRCIDNLNNIEKNISILEHRGTTKKLTDNELRKLATHYDMRFTINEVLNELNNKFPESEV